MNLEERLIVSAYTGTMMVDASTFRAWLSEKGYPDPLLYPIPELANKALSDLKQAVSEDFLKLCREGEEVE